MCKIEISDKNMSKTVLEDSALKAQFNNIN